MEATHETEKQQIPLPRVPFDFCSLSIRDQMNSKLLLLAVVDLDAVMTGDSRPPRDRQRFPVKGRLTLKSGHSEADSDRQP